MQLMPATAAFIAQDRRYRRSHKHKLHDPVLNLHLGQKYIGHLLAEPHINGTWCVCWQLIMAGLGT
ncbi:MAG: hypothetical protein CM15mP80_08770 [Alphaproteobacteria bacterium]|nr:MAG: hypothetical protein CM15mP80_08770 [Alphaproteobacteria bacterium]